ncbi:hypothetical protein HAX54_029060, partial [Datura stramonium]|nr:hypothetical protein [Datura stramonium]
ENEDLNDDMRASREVVNSLKGLGHYHYRRRKLSLDLENRSTPPAKISIEEPPN